MLTKLSFKNGGVTILGWEDGDLCTLMGEEKGHVAIKKGSKRRSSGAHGMGYFTGGTTQIYIFKLRPDEPVFGEYNEELYGKVVMAEIVMQFPVRLNRKS